MLSHTSVESCAAATLPGLLLGVHLADHRQVGCMSLGLLLLPVDAGQLTLGRLLLGLQPYLVVSCNVFDPQSREGRNCSPGALGDFSRCLNLTGRCISVPLHPYRMPEPLKSYPKIQSTIREAEGWFSVGVRRSHLSLVVGVVFQVVPLFARVHTRPQVAQLLPVLRLLGSLHSNLGNMYSSLSLHARATVGKPFPLPDWAKVGRDGISLLPLFDVIVVVMALKLHIQKGLLVGGRGGGLIVYDVTLCSHICQCTH